MTIDEAIKQEKEKAVDCRQGAEVVKNMTYATWERENLPKQYIERAEYHEQLAEWLEELKFRRVLLLQCEKEFFAGYEKGKTEGYTKAIDDFAEKIMEYCSMSDMNKKMIRQIAEQLKEGGVE